MKLDCVLTSVNEVEMYINFIPYFIKTWKKLYPNIDIKIILISNKIPDKFSEYEKYIILFNPIQNISTVFISQYIRILYPAILDYKNGIMITDIDIIPMNRTYYEKNIENIGNDKFIYMRNVLLETKEIAICYNVALNKTWSEICKIKTLTDIEERLIKKSKEGISWSTDQQDLYKNVNEWNNITNNFVILNDNKTGFCRLDRGMKIKMKINYDSVKNKIRNGFYSDYHCLRPFTEHEKINNIIYDLL